MRLKNFFLKEDNSLYIFTSSTYDIHTDKNEKNATKELIHFVAFLIGYPN